MRIAVLVKQVPAAEDLKLGSDGRLQRDRVAAEIDPYSRRAIATGINLVKLKGGECVLFTLGPERSAQTLYEGLSAGADSGVLVSDKVFAGSDAAVTARVLAAALIQEGPFDLIIAGRNSVDSGTGQVAPSVAEHLGMPFIYCARKLTISEGIVHATSEMEWGNECVRTSLPAVVSVAERICPPIKVPRDIWEGRAGNIRTLNAAILTGGPWKAGSSPTHVGKFENKAFVRARRMTEGTPREQVDSALSWLIDKGAFMRRKTGPSVRVPCQRRGLAPSVAVVCDPERYLLCRELTALGALIANKIGGNVIVLTVRNESLDLADLASMGADHVIEYAGCNGPRSFSESCTNTIGNIKPWCVLALGTGWGREVASRISVQLSVGLVSDAIRLDVAGSRLISWKVAFDGRSEVAITADSDIQMVVVRPGIIGRVDPRIGAECTVEHIDVDRVASDSAFENDDGAVRPKRPRPRDVVVTDQIYADDPDALASAAFVLGVGVGIAPEDYCGLEELRTILGAELGATRRVTDKGWLPRSRQIGLTGCSISPRLYVAIGISGKYNHMVGVSGSDYILAINNDPNAPIFDDCDVGIVADWKVALPIITKILKYKCC